MSHELSEKAIACLRIAEAHSTDSWHSLYEEACTRFSAQAIDLKMEDLEEEGYIEYGVSARTGWLTDKGRAALDNAHYRRRWITGMGAP